MNEAAWERLTDAVDVKFGISDHGSFKRPLEDRPDLTEQVEYVQFIKGGEDFRLERITKPAIIDRKSFHGRSATSSVRFENVYDEHDFSSKVEFYRKVGDDWQIIDAGELSLG